MLPSNDENPTILSIQLHLNEPIPTDLDSIANSPGCSFTNICDQVAGVVGQTGSSVVSASTLMDCVNACDADLSCNVYVFDGVALTCSLYDNATSATSSSAPSSAYGIYEMDC
jgi:hypothetical protein